MTKLMKSKTIFVVHIISTIFLAYNAYLLANHHTSLKKNFNFFFSVAVFLLIFILAFKVEYLDEKKKQELAEKRKAKEKKAK